MVAAVSAPRQGLPEAWVTSIAGILADEDHCHYAPWYAARHWLKGDGSFDREGWIAQHKALRETREAQLKADGYEPVRVEKQNAFTLHGDTAKLSGRPDLIAHRRSGVVTDIDPISISAPIVLTEDVLVSDAKTGQPKGADYWQILIYLLALPRVRPDFSDVHLRGELVYNNGSVRTIEIHEVTPEAKASIFALMREIGFRMPPEKTPSERECQFCRLSTDECAEKARMVGTRAEGKAEEF